MPAASPAIVFSTPRRLPKPASLAGRVVVLDIAFAADGTGSGFAKVTGVFIAGLGARLAAWIDHHDHQRHADFENDSRFVLRKKSEHGACPELVTPERVKNAGPVDTIVCHDDFDGLCAAAKWLRGGVEPYAGADVDARAIDTRTGTVGALGTSLDRALRARPRDHELRATIVRFLADGAHDTTTRAHIESVAAEFVENERNAQALAAHYRVAGRAAVVDATGFAERQGPYDKTFALLLGQNLAPVAVVYDASTVTLAAPFDSGENLLELLGIAGGMPTRVSVPRARLPEVLRLLGAQSLSEHPESGTSSATPSPHAR